MVELFENFVVMIVRLLFQRLISATCLMISWVLVNVIARFFLSGNWSILFCDFEHICFSLLRHTLSYTFYQVNAVKFNEYATVVVSAGYDQSLRAWDCRSHSTEPIQVISLSLSVLNSCPLPCSEICHLTRCLETFEATLVTDEAMQW